MENACITFLNVTMDICYKAQRQKNQKRSWKKNAHLKLTSENSSGRKQYMLCSYLLAAYK